MFQIAEPKAATASPSEEELVVWRETESFKCVYDPTMAATDVVVNRCPNYFIIFKPTGKVEAITSSALAAWDMVPTMEEAWQMIKEGKKPDDLGLDMPDPMPPTTITH